MTKSEARMMVKQLKANMTEEQISNKSKIILEKLVELPEFKNADKVLTYVNYNQEVETMGLIKLCFELGKEVYVPKVYGKDMKFHNIDSFRLLTPGKYGILEPYNEYRDEWDYLSGIMIMPGLAFGRDFSRAGYGGGFYDRYLSKHSEVLTIAVCFDFQLLDSIEIEDYDYRPDIIISDKEIIRRSV